ncbi:MAG: hypothetical protein ABFD62_01050 [Syntrophaceae bacterium]
MKAVSPDAHIPLRETIKRAHASGYRIFDPGRTDAGNTGLMNCWGMEVTDIPQYFYPERVRCPV